MSRMEEKGGDLSVYKQFLEGFLSSADPDSEDEPFPHRILTSYITEDEIEGECLDWALQYLGANRCPPLLACHVARAVTDDMLRIDFTPYYEKDDEEEKSAEDGDATRKSDDTDILGDEEQEEEKTNNSPQKLDVDRFAKTVYYKIKEVLARWKDELPELNFATNSPEVSTYAIKNLRRKMEDRHLVLPDLNSLLGIKDKSPQSYYAVFDGHGGVEAASYATTHLHCNVAKHPSYYTDVHTALREGCLTTDQNFEQKAKYESFRSGSTAVCAIVRDSQLHLAWLGDSQAVLVRDGQVVQLMSPHKPEREDERKRIEELGGCVVWYGTWRVNFNLSVSRAIGDTGYKPYISAEMDSITVDLDGTEDYLILGCDGLWDGISFEEAMHGVYEHIHENKGDRSTVAPKLIRLAKDRGSSDNITAIVVFLRDNIAKPKETVKPEENDVEQDDSKDDEGDKGGDSGGDSAGDGGGGTDQSEGKDSDKSDEPEGSQPPDQDSSKPDDSGDSKANDSNKEDKTVDSVQRASSKVSPSFVLCSSNGSGALRHTKETAAGGLSNASEKISAAALKSTTPSDASSTDLAVVSRAATHCLNNRKIRKGKGRKKRQKENRRPSQGLNTGVALQTNNSTPVKSERGGANVGTKGRPPVIRQSKSQLLEMLTGVKREATRKLPATSKWTVAFEIDGSAAMF